MFTFSVSFHCLSRLKIFFHSSLARVYVILGILLNTTHTGIVMRCPNFFQNSQDKNKYCQIPFLLPQEISSIFYYYPTTESICAELSAREIRRRLLHLITFASARAFQMVENLRYAQIIPDPL